MDDRPGDTSAVEELGQISRRLPPRRQSPRPARSNEQSIAGRTSLFIALLGYGLWVAGFILTYASRDMPQSQLRGFETLGYICMLDLVVLLAGIPLAVAGILSPRYRRSDAATALGLHVGLLLMPYILTAVAALARRR